MITDICCGISAIFLVLTILLLLITRDKKDFTIIERLKKKRNSIPINLCLCILVSDLLIVFGLNEIDTRPEVRFRGFSKSKFKILTE